MEELDLLQAVVSRDSLANRIISSFEPSTFDTRPQNFLPEDCTSTLVTLDSIREELRPEFDNLAKHRSSFDQEWQEKFVGWIFANAKKVFAVTVLCDVEPMTTLHTLIRFRALQFDDESLPIENPKTRIHGPSPRKFDKDVFDPKMWGPARVYDFYEKQWKCLAPVFAPEEYSYDVLSECIFPFFRLGSIPKEGAFGSVSKVKIHQAHQRHQKLDVVAVKEIKVSRGEDKTGTDKAWEDEARALDSIKKLDHNHIIKCIAAIRRGDSRYFMFPWADGDNLREFWESAPEPISGEQTVKETLVQLRGLVDALDRLHHFNGGSLERTMTESFVELLVPKSQYVTVQNEVDEYEDAANKESIRHGDLKPENILRFVNGETGLGILKIADLGLAKRHVVATEDRSRLTITSYGTIMYEAPEAETAIHGRSRLYDIWSMGCITLEFIIWILYGNEALKAFYTELKGNAHVCKYFEIPENTKRAELHKVVLQWMRDIQNKDPECSQDSAINDLLKIVREYLLVVPLPPNRANSLSPGLRLAPPARRERTTEHRATAREFREALDEMLTKVDRPGYLLTGKPRKNARPTVTKPSTLLSPIAAQRIDRHTGLKPSPLGRPSSSSAGGFGKAADYTLPPLKDWEFPVDNAFALKVVAEVGPRALRPQPNLAAKLCDRCKGLDFWAGGFAFEDRISDLMERGKFCDFCRMVLMLCDNTTALNRPKVRFERNQSTLTLAGGDPLPAMSIFRCPELKTPLPIQLGFPELPTPGTTIYFKIIKAWLEDCDNDASHKDCHGLPPARLPTRLIDVGTQHAPILRLLETSADSIEDDRYIALSHPWGDPEKHPPFRTLRHDDSGKGRTLQNFKTAIPYDKLPATFKDTVDTTRALNIRYLWIDSICIIQGKDGDFNEESKRMEEVFSGAYCVLAASRATNQHDGFLGSRQQRDYISFQRGHEEPFYVCAPIDNVSRDVLEGSLNRRGWVLQERALARRTIYFAETQTYFECGNGIRCETLAKMHNNMADFLGDPKFPDKAMRTTSRALKISYFQDLYRQYSRLEFSRIEDRPIAIAGLEKRLIKAFGTAGGYGIFDDGADGGLFHRSLLWQRGEEEACMASIVFPVERNIKVPSWSWMAYKGGIDYGDPPFETADWTNSDVRPPWTRGGNGPVETTPQEPELALGATVRDFTVAGRKADEVRLVYDTERTASDGQRAQCVIVARSLDGATDQEKRLYVLLVVPTGLTAARGEAIYKRVGAGYLLGKYISLDKNGIAAKIY